MNGDHSVLLLAFARFLGRALRTRSRRAVARASALSASRAAIPLEIPGSAAATARSGIVAPDVLRRDDHVPQGRRAKTERADIRVVLQRHVNNAPFLWA